MPPLPITFLSDYGYEDEFAGVCRGVMSSISPDSPIIDLTHGIPRHDVRSGAAALARALPFCAEGVHLAVVDPGVGTERRPVAVRVADEERYLVGPNNGILAPAIRRFGGIAEAVDLRDSGAALERVYKTFHGRDIFAPVAAHLARGEALSTVGDLISPDLISLPAGLTPTITGEKILAHVTHIDQYGNIALDAIVDELGDHPIVSAERVMLTVKGRTATAIRGETFSDAPKGTMLIYEDSSGALSLAINRGSMAESIGVKPGNEVAIAPTEAA